MRTIKGGKNFYPLTSKLSVDYLDYSSHEFTNLFLKNSLSLLDFFNSTNSVETVVSALYS